MRQPIGEISFSQVTRTTYSTRTWCRPQVLSVPRTGVILSTGAKSSRSTCRLPHLGVGCRTSGSHSQPHRSLPLGPERAQWLVPGEW